MMMTVGNWSSWYYPHTLPVIRTVILQCLQSVKFCVEIPSLCWENCWNFYWASSLCCESIGLLPCAVRVLTTGLLPCAVRVLTADAAHQVLLCDYWTCVSWTVTTTTTGIICYQLVIYIIMIILVVLVLTVHRLCVLFQLMSLLNNVSAAVPLCLMLGAWWM